MELREELCTRFGYRDFRPGQEEIIRDVLAGGERLVVLPTGGGKSLCYLLPAGIQQGRTLVISPLIALMEDQLARARAAGLRAAIWNRQTGFEALLQAEIIFCSPEKIAAAAKDRLAQLEVWHLVIDEAHCVEDWGGSFRPLYNQLGQLRALLAPKSVSVFTASADERQRASLAKRLGLEEVRYFVHGFDRPNIAWHCHQTEAPLLAAVRLIERREGRAIIYCPTRLATSKVAGALQLFGLEARPFHAGMRPEIRNRLQNEFASGRLRILAATSAFGMGVDVSAVRTVIHLGLPRGSNAYYQESGRAGRDGEAALAVLFFHPDESTWQDSAKKQKRLLRSLLRRYPEGWSLGFGEEQPALLEAGEDPAAISAFLLQQAVCRLDSASMRIIPVGNAGELLEAALREEELRRRDEYAWARRYSLGTGVCRRKLLLERFEQSTTLVCRGCDQCGSVFSGLLAEVLAQVSREATSLKEYLACPWSERDPSLAEVVPAALQLVLKKRGCA